MSYFHGLQNYRINAGQNKYVYLAAITGGF